MLMLIWKWVRDGIQYHQRTNGLRISVYTFNAHDNVVGER